MSLECKLLGRSRPYHEYASAIAAKSDERGCLRKQHWSSVVGHSRSEGVQFGRTRCNLRSCKQGGGLAIRINYFLPTWLSQRMISAWYTSTPLCGPELLLKIYRVVDFRKDPLVKAITCGRLEDLQTLLTTGTVSPYIIKPIWSLSAACMPVILQAAKVEAFTDCNMYRSLVSL